MVSCNQLKIVIRINKKLNFTRPTLHIHGPKDSWNQTTFHSSLIQYLANSILRHMITSVYLEKYYAIQRCT